jgi:hypothetical protein
MSRFTIIVPVILKYYHPSLGTVIPKLKEEVMAGKHKRNNNHA